MAYQKSTIYKTSANSTIAAMVKWTVIEPSTGCYIDANGMVGDRFILLVGSASTKGKAGARYLFIGTSSTADSASTKLKFSGGRGRMKVSLTTAGDSLWKGDSRDALPGTSGRHALNVLGPFETARVKDTDGYINIASLSSGTTGTMICAIELV